MEKSIDLSNLVEISRSQLAIYRRGDVPGVVVKVGNNLYYAELDDTVEYHLPFEPLRVQLHKCYRSCSRLSAASDEKGGCAKVRALAQGIENYPWITYGYETINTFHIEFFVLECEHYEKCKPPKKILSHQELRSTYLELAMFIWDDVYTYDQAKRRAHRKNIP